MTKSPFGIFLACALLIALFALVPTVSVRLPGNDIGYEPSQPIAYSHRVHAGELGIDCQYCHYAAESSPVAGVPPASVCMNCHTEVTASKNAKDAEKLAAGMEQREPRPIISPELHKLYEALGLDDERKPIPGRTPQPIRWARVHDLPDFAVFDHRVHVARGVACQACHGPVETMERVRQISSLSMGWCIDCHRVNAKDGTGAIDPVLGHSRHPDHVTIDCSACHF
jgi:hypothetical protein